MPTKTNSEKCKRRRKQGKPRVKHKSERLRRKKHSNEKEISKNKVERNKSSDELCCKKCKTTFKELFDNVAHACSASTSTNNLKTKSNRNSVVKVSCSPPSENHQTLCNSNKNCVAQKKIVRATKYALRSEPSKLLDENRQTTSSQNSTTNKANYPFLRSNDINSSNSSVHNEILLIETVSNFDLSENYRSDINIRKSFDKDKCIAKRKKVSSKKVPVLPGDNSSFESSKVNLQNNSDFSQEMVTAQQISDQSPRLSKEDEMLGKENINEITETNVNTTKVQTHFTRNKNMKTSDSKVQEATLESSLSGAPSKIVKSKRDIRVASKEQEQLNLKFGNRKKSSESSVSSEPEKGVKVVFQKTNCEEIKLENLIHLLPDSQSGVLIKLPGENENFKCVKCGKTSGTASLGSIHIICCKASYKKNKSVVLDDLVWVCTFCHNRFDSRADLLKHKTACPYPSPPTYSEEKDTAECPKKILFEGPINKCKKCGLTCRSSITFAKHQCKKRLNHMKKCKVLLGHCPKYDFDSKKITFYQCRNCKKDFLERYMLKIHLKQCAPKERLNTIKPMYLKRRDYDDLHPTHLIKREPSSDVLRDNTANFSTSFNQAIPFDTRILSDAAGSLFMRVANSMPTEPTSINQPSTAQQVVDSVLNMPSTSHQQFRIPINHLSNTSQHSFRVPNIQQPPAPQYQFIQPVSNLNASWKTIKEYIGCNCPPQNQGNNSNTEDCKPCGVCLRKFVANLQLGGRYSDSLNSEFSEPQEPSKSLNQKAPQPRSFPTPPKTPDNIASSSTPSLLSHSTATLQDVPIESFQAELREEEAAVSSDIPMEIDFSNLKFAWYDDSDTIDAFAFVNSEEDLEVLRYVCANCFDTLYKEDILNHCVQHGITNCVNVSYVIRPPEK